MFAVVRSSSLSAVLVAETARRPGAGVDPDAVRSAQRRLVTGVVPHIPAAAPVPMGSGIRALAGMHGDICPRLQAEGAERVDMTGGIADRPTGQRPGGGTRVLDPEPLGVQAGVAASVATRRVVINLAELNGTCSLRRRRIEHDGADTAERDGDKTSKQSFYSHERSPEIWRRPACQTHEP